MEQYKEPYPGTVPRNQEPCCSVPQGIYNRKSAFGRGEFSLDRSVRWKAEDKKGVDAIQKAHIEAAKDQAKSQAEKELALKELDLKAQIQVQYQCCS